MINHPLYGKPCPPPPDFYTDDPSGRDKDLTDDKQEFFEEVTDWMLVNCAYRENQGKDRIVSLIDGSIVSVTDMRTRMMPWDLLAGGKPKSPVTQWLKSTARISIHGEARRSDMDWPIFTENGQMIYNHYRPPAQPAQAVNRKQRLLPPPTAPLKVAVQFFADNHALPDGGKALYRWRGSWWAWRTSHWEEIAEEALRAQVYEFTAGATYIDAEKGVQDWDANDRRVSDVVDALISVCLLADAVEQPSWLDGRTSGVLIPCANGLYDLESDVLLPHSPLLFNVAAVPFAYDPDASEPVEWNKFTKSVWPNSPESIDRLEEWMGYVVSGRTHLHKILFIQGPPRGGRGTIGRILGKLLGPGSTCGPTLASIGSGEDGFGLAPFIGKALAVIGDARFTGKNIVVAIERLLSISGEDTLTINRKYKGHWIGKLIARIMIFSNELLKLPDASTAIISRLVPLLMTISWLGKEDLQLEDKLSRELPGILNRALAGLKRLNANGGKFTPVERADAMLQDLEALASPVLAFVRELCELGADHEEECRGLYRSYKQWCTDNGHKVPSSAVFGKNLFAAFPDITKRRKAAEQQQPEALRAAMESLQALGGTAKPEDRKYVYAGIRIRKEPVSQASDTTPPQPKGTVTPFRRSRSKQTPSPS
jgi:putative DNA primase/helicase